MTTYFEDIVVGEEHVLGSHTFTADEIIAFATKYDPQPFHLSEEAAAKSQFGQLCASGWHTAAMFMRLSVDMAKARKAAALERGEAVLKQGGGYVNNRRVESLDTNLSEQDLASDTVIVLRRGKKKYALVRVAN